MLAFLHVLFLLVADTTWLGALQGDAERLDKTSLVSTLATLLPRSSPREFA
jgi:hypothetical protein